MLIIAWPDLVFTGLIFISWIPLLFVAKEIKDPRAFFVCSLTTTLIWNTGTTWWIWNSTGPGAVGAIIANSLLMCIPLWGYFSFNKRLGSSIGFIALISFWLTFEYIHLNWQLSWPWLTLGNAFAMHPGWVQWYESTGVGGGSTWILLVNVLLFLLVNSKSLRKRLTIGSLAVFAILLPIAGSKAIERQGPNEVQGQQNNIVMVQPNIDPYNEKFDLASSGKQIEKLILLSEQNLDTNTKLVLWPETALPVGVWQDRIKEEIIYAPVFNFVKRHPQLTLLSGIESYKSYGTKKETTTARKIEGSDIYYDAFNAAVSLKNNQPILFYNKSKLVPGVETLPDFLIWLGDIFAKFGGTTGGYGHNKFAEVFKVNENPYISAPIICYESIYGEYVTEYAKKNANVLTIITNDGWWGNTPGHRQHLAYARLRSIETRKWVARSANTGISAVIDNYGKIQKELDWDTAGAIKYNIPPVEGKTFYVEFGDIIYKISLAITFFLLLMYFSLSIKKRMQNSKNG